MMQSDISVVIPTKNNATTIALTLDSLGIQRFPADWEIIVVDDGCVDGTLDVVRGHDLFCQQRIRIVRNPRAGLAAAYNIGCTESRFPLLILMHGDCYVTSPTAAADMVLCFADSSVVGAMSIVTVPSDLWERMSFWDRVSNARYLGLESHGFGGKFDAIRKEALQKIGGFDEMHFFSAGEDYDMVIRLGAVGKLAKTGVKVTHDHQHPPRRSFVSLLRKQGQLGEGLGALLRTHGCNRIYVDLVIAQGTKMVLFAGLLVPVARWGALFLLAVLSLAYSWRAFLQKDMRVLLIPFANLLQFAVLACAVMTGYLRGRQRFRYK